MDVVRTSLCCAEHKAVKLLRELEDIDLIERKRRGLGRPSLQQEVLEEHREQITLHKAAKAAFDESEFEKSCQR